MENKKLAIVIPAYKASYFRQALDSIINQTCKDFTLYIGDDCSPYNLSEIVEAYKEYIPIVYKRFDKNSGGKNLVDHWNRCIDMVRDEDYIWFFSDDDKMEKNCVADFYQALKNVGEKDLFHFNVQVIDENDRIIKPVAYKKKSFPAYMTQIEYIKGRLNFQLNSFIVEYIFRKNRFEEVGRFQKFDLAWGTDDATWMKMATRNGIHTIETSKVFWRLSSENISPDKSHDIVIRKMDSTFNFLTFIKRNMSFKEKDKCCFNYWLHSMWNACSSLRKQEVLSLNRNFKKTFEVSAYNQLKLDILCGVRILLNKY